MAQVTAEMGSEYQRIFARSTEDPATAGDEGEENWASLFREWLPPGYHVQTKGRLLGHDGRASPQIDLVILKPSYPRKLLEKKMWMAGGVAAAFECKTTLTAKHVRDSVDRCVKFKSLMQPRQGSPRREINSPLVYGILAHSHSWKGEKSDPIANIEAALGVESEIKRPCDLIDVMCVADLGSWSRVFTAKYGSEWLPPEDAQAFQAAFGSSWAVTTGMICAPASQGGVFKPIGALLSDLTRRLAWEDQSVRDIADYYRMTKLSGEGSGTMRFWPPTVYSDGTRQRVSTGLLSNGAAWDEWAIAGF
jgi:hypothetical protein